MKTTQNGNAAAQGAAATTNAAVDAGNTANTPTIVKAKKMPPKKRQPAEAKQKKESKFLSGGVMIRVATVSYNHWREFVNEIINGEDKEAKRIARFEKDETALNTKWGGFIATNAENVEAVTAKLSAWTAENNARPEDEQYADLWKMLEHFQTVEPKPRAPRKKKEETAAETTQA